jgi:hypothetical protein
MTQPESKTSSTAHEAHLRFLDCASKAESSSCPRQKAKSWKTKANYAIVSIKRHKDVFAEISLNVFFICMFCAFLCSVGGPRSPRKAFLGSSSTLDCVKSNFSGYKLLESLRSSRAKLFSALQQTRARDREKY